MKLTFIGITYRMNRISRLLLFLSLPVAPPDILFAQAPVIPSPTGPYATGTAIYHLTDSGRADFVSGQKGTYTEMMIQAWYPAEPSATLKKAPYITDTRILDEMIKEKFEGQDPALISSLQFVKTDALLNAALVRGKKRFPLLIASPGLGSPRFTLTAFAQQLASYGYIVIAIDHPYCFTLLPDGRVQTMDQLKDYQDDDAGNARLAGSRARDASFLLTILEEHKIPSLENIAARIDKNKVGIFGHSMGGAVALEACQADQRFKAAIDLDGIPFGKVVTEGFNCPTLVFASQMKYTDEELAKRGRTKEQMAARGKQRADTWAPLFRKAKDAKYWVKVSGTNHVHFSDYPFIMPGLYLQFGGQAIDATRGFQLITAYMRAFFDQYLSGKKSSLLKGPSSLYPEVSIGPEPF